MRRYGVPSKVLTDNGKQFTGRHTHLRVLHGEEELAVRPRRNLDPITRLHVTGTGVQNGQA